VSPHGHITPRAAKLLPQTSDVKRDVLNLVLVADVSSLLWPWDMHALAARGLEKTMAGADLTFSQERPEKSPFFFSFSNESSQAFTPET
jgi:hypothetical protein